MEEHEHTLCGDQLSLWHMCVSSHTRKGSCGSPLDLSLEEIKTLVLELVCLQV